MKLHKIISFFAAVALVSLSSCSDDEVATPITSDGEVETSGTSYDTLSFEWDKIDGATQYGYELLDPNDDVVYRDVTSLTSATIGSLQPATEYTLKVWGYPAIGSGHVQSEPIVIKATTDPLKTLAAPRLSTSSAEVTNTVSWTKVTGATQYEYTLTNAAGEQISSGTTTSRSVTFTHLDKGDYTATVRALSTTAGYETTGAESTIDFTSDIVELWSAEGTYTSAVLNKSWDATILCYGGGHYTVKDWYGISGYDFDFYIDSSDPDDLFQIYSYYQYSNDNYCYQIPTGRSDIGALNVYPWYNECSLGGSSTKGTATFCIYLNGSYVYDTYTWKGTYDGIPADDFVGTWNVAMTGTTYLGPKGEDYDDLEDININTTIEITKVDDTTIQMPALFFSSVKMNVMIDMIERTLTVDPMTVATWYTLAGTSSIGSQIIGKINDDGSFEFNDWTAWYTSWTYMYDCTAKYTR